MSLKDSLKNKIAQKARESTEKKKELAEKSKTPEQLAAEADAERRKQLDSQQKQFDDERKLFDNEKKKRQAIQYCIIAVLVTALAVFIGVSATRAHNAKLYDKSIVCITEGEYKNASELLNKLGDNYRDVKALKKLNKALDYYDSEDRYTYEKTVSLLSSSGGIENKLLEEKRESTLDEAQTLYAQYQLDLKTASDISNIIAQACTDVTIYSEPAVIQAKQLYEEQSDTVKAYIKNAYMLDDATKDIEALKQNTEKAKAVEKKIAKIGKVTLKSKRKIESARNAYDELTFDEAALVNNYKTLEKAENKYRKLVRDEKNKKG